MQSPSISINTKGDLYISVDHDPLSFDQANLGYGNEADFSPCSYTTPLKENNQQFLFFERS